MQPKLAFLGGKSGLSQLRFMALLIIATVLALGSARAQPASDARPPQQGSTTSPRLAQVTPPPSGPQVVTPPPSGPQVVTPPPSGPQVVTPPPSGPQVVTPPLSGPQVVTPPPSGPQVVTPPLSGPQVVTPPLSGPQVVTPPRSASTADQAAAAARYYGQFETQVLAGGSVNDLRIPTQPVNLTHLPENTPGHAARVTISWKPTGYESDKSENWVCPPERRVPSSQIDVRAKRPVSESDNSKTVLSVDIPDPPCIWPLTQDARITIKGEVQGLSGEQTFYDQIVPVSVFWFPLLATILVLALIYPGCALTVWYMRDRRHRQETRDALRRGEPPPDAPASLLATLDPVQITANEFGRASVAKLQVFAFSLIVFGVLLFYQLRCGLLAGLSKDVMYLMGISAAGATGGKIVYGAKQRLSLENWAWLRRRRWLPENGDMVPRAKWSELFLDADTKEFDPYSFQMVIFSVVVAVALIRTNLSGLGAFTIPEQLLQLLGLSQVVFVGGKAIEKSAYNQLEEKLKEVRKHEEEFQRLTAQKASGVQTAEAKDPEVERQAFKSDAVLAAEMFWATYGERIGEMPDELKEIGKIQPHLP